MELEKVHVVLFPYMSKGHMIPMLQLARLLLSHSFARDISVTVFTTPLNRPFFADSLSGTKATVIALPFPKNVPEIPPGLECTDKLPAISSLHVPFTRATESMQPDFERELASLPRVSFMVSDGFLWWTLESALKLGFPRLVFLGMNCASPCILDSVFENQLLSKVKSETEAVAVPEFPWIKVRKCDFVEDMSDAKLATDPGFKLIIDQVTSMSKSQGIIFNTFDDLEPVFIDFYKRTRELRPWTLGPLCLAKNSLEDEGAEKVKTVWMKWLDEKRDKGCNVLYVAFGSQAEIQREQVEEIALGLEESKVNFLWVLKGNEIGKGFEERVGERGMAVKDEWVDQRKILEHESVRGFLSHCGWNSLMESICAGVPILAFPVAAEQPLNAILVVEELRVAERVVAASGGVARRGEVAKKVKELMEGEKGKELRRNVEAYSKMAKKALEEGVGSSWKNLDNLINEFCNNGT
ncbi:UDP-glycosyltransferase 90A2 [Raphanus sativus]|uniref:Glycosyltransferase n=1 Tax=Raphanus sativus TaxID=3726 RepID=A0A6J0JV18_RAPSA|nr:UDP-glycosyltransferase 90A2-like [Raphanus sativus]KAJ4869266.1 UDP-glycosyltransferase 90A2 [Raphanus sativus]